MGNRGTRDDLVKMIEKAKNEPSKKEIMELLYGHFGDDAKVNEWLATKNPLLGNARPIEMLAFDRHDKLLQFVEHQLAENMP